MAYGIASSGVRRVDVMNLLASEIMCRDGFTLQAIANISWAFKILEMQQLPLSIHLEGLVARRLIEVKGIPAQKDVESLLGILWASPGNEALAGAITNSLQRLGQKMDELSHCQLQIQPGEGPQVVLQVPGVAVIAKPEGWEVDTVGADREGTDTSRKLSNFVDGLKFGEKSGFIGRLDMPSSGLLLHATSFEALFMLQAQRELGLLERDYLVLSHGWLSSFSRDISAKLRRVGRKAQVSATGRPALTRVKLLAHLAMDGTNPSDPNPVSFLAVRIGSGRMHQIRCHLAHVGHPVVGDRRYSEERNEARHELLEQSSRKQHLSASMFDFEINIEYQQFFVSNNATPKLVPAQNLFQGAAFLVPLPSGLPRCPWPAAGRAAAVAPGAAGVPPAVRPTGAARCDEASAVAGRLAVELGGSGSRKVWPSAVELLSN